MVEFAHLDATSAIEEWDEAAAFLRVGFGRSFSTRKLIWEFRHGFLVTARDADGLVGTQGFLRIDLDVGGRVVISGKSERTLVAQPSRGTGLYEELYAVAVSSAVERLGARLLWGVTAVPTSFAKVGYFVLDRVYRHTVLPVAPVRGLRVGNILRARVGRGRRGGMGGREINPVLSAEYLAWQFADHPDATPVVCRSADGAAVATVDATGQARLRFLHAESEEQLGLHFGHLLAELTRTGARSLRVSWNPAAPSGRLLGGLLHSLPWPSRRGGGFFIVRPLGLEDLRLIGTREGWNLCGWENLIHEPVSTWPPVPGPTEPRH